MLWQYQAKTEPVFVPAAVDTSDVEFAATSPSFSEPVRPLINTAILLAALTGFTVPNTGDANELRDFTPLSEPVRPVAQATYVQEPIPLSTTFIAGDAAELREFIQIPDVIRPLLRVAQNQFLAIDPDVRIPVDLREGWFQALSEPVRPVPRAVYVQYDTLPLATPFLPGDANQLNEFIQLPDVIRLVVRVAHTQVLLDPFPRPDAPVVQLEWYRQLSEPVRLPDRAPDFQVPLPLTTTFLPGDADALREFIQLPDVIRPVERVAQDQFLAIDSDVRIPIDLREGWFQALSEPVRPLERAVYVQEPIPLTTAFLSGSCMNSRSSPGISGIGSGSKNKNGAEIALSTGRITSASCVKSRSSLASPDKKGVVSGIAFWT